MKNKFMQLKYLAAACMALGASSAFAVTPPTVCDATTSAATLVNTCTPEVIMYVAGSSALGNAIKAAVPVDLFDGVITQVTAGTGLPNASATSAWYGTAKSTLGTAAGKKLFVVYNNQNGSAAGISQLLSPTKDTTIPEQDVVTIGPMSKVAGVVAATQATSVGGANTCTLGADTTVGTVTYHNVTCTTHARTQADVGLSDVRPDLLFALEGLKPKKLTTLTYTPIAMQGFGLAVNANLYNAMQAKQLLDGRIPSTCSAGDLTAACQPTISRADYASLVTVEGGIKSAAKLLNDPADTTLLTLSRRDDLSGTQATSNMYFADNACGVSVDSKGKIIKGVLGGALTVLGSPVPATIVNPVYSVAGVLNVNAQATGGGVKTDLNGTTGYVIGAIGLGEAEPVRTATSWKYVKLDGVSPNFNADGTAAHANRTPFANGNYGLAVTSYAATAIKPLNKGSVVTAFPTVVSALMTGLKDSTLHDLPGIAYLDGAADPSLDGFNKQAHYIHTAGNSCSPLIKM